MDPVFTVSTRKGMSNSAILVRTNMGKIKYFDIFDQIAFIDIVTVL